MRGKGIVCRYLRAENRMFRLGKESMRGKGIICRYLRAENRMFRF